MTGQNIDELKPGEGLVQEDPEQPKAYCRDTQGQLHVFSAECTHAQCTVEWNGGDKTWDCPCHGSRFSADGQVLNGPATEPLVPIE